MPKLVSALGFFELGRKMKEIENMIDAADSHKSSDSMDEEVLGQLCLDLWACIWAGGLGETAEGKRLRRAMIEALNLDE